VHLLDRIAIVYRYRRVALSVFVLTTLAMMIEGYTSVHMFQAQARLLIENERSTAIPGLTTTADSYYEDPEPYYQTQYKILKGRDLARRVVRRLNLGAVPEFNGTAAPPATPLTFVSDLKARVLGRLRGAPAPVDPPRVDESADESALVGAFLGRVQVEPVRGSRLVDVFFQSTDAQFAATAANALAEEYVNQNLELKLSSTENMLEWLDKELANREFIAGSRYSIADITALVGIDFGRTTGIKIAPELKNLTRWHQAVSGRPSAKA
jgi:uncharacterized protein involved in exopolysaccharide biosynthesis